MSRKRFPRSRGSVGNEPPAYLRHGETRFSESRPSGDFPYLVCRRGTRGVGKIRKGFAGGVEMRTFFVSLTDGMKGLQHTYELYSKIHRFYCTLAMYSYKIYITEMRLKLARFYFSFQLFFKPMSSVHCI